MLGPPLHFLHTIICYNFFMIVWPQLSRLLLYGFTTYAAIFMLWAIFGSYGFASGPAPMVTSWAATAIVVFYAAKLLSPESFKKTFFISILWTLMHLLFDALYVIPAAGIEALGTYYAWVNYAIVFVLPFFALVVHKIVSIPKIPSVSAP